MASLFSVDCYVGDARSFFRVFVTLVMRALLISVDCYVSDAHSVVFLLIVSLVMTAVCFVF